MTTDPTPAPSAEALADAPPDLPSQIAAEIMALDWDWVGGAKYSHEYRQRELNRRHGEVQAIVAAALRSSAPAAPAQLLEFGHGTLLVDSGTYYGRPAVFVAQVTGAPGEPGTEAPAEERGDRHTLKPGEVVLTFPSWEQAQAVANAMWLPTKEDALENEVAGMLSAFGKGYQKGRADATAPAPAPVGDELRREIEDAEFRALESGEDSLDLILPIIERRLATERERADKAEARAAELAEWWVEGKRRITELEAELARLRAPQASEADDETLKRVLINEIGDIPTYNVGVISSKPRSLRGELSPELLAGISAKVVNTLHSHLARAGLRIVPAVVTEAGVEAATRRYCYYSAEHDGHDCDCKSPADCEAYELDMPQMRAALEAYEQARAAPKEN